MPEWTEPGALFAPPPPRGVKQRLGDEPNDAASRQAWTKRARATVVEVLGSHAIYVANPVADPIE
jgi:hypothetical protein